jgi:hypothetical protein
MSGANRNPHRSRHTDITMKTRPAGMVGRSGWAGRSGPLVAGAGRSLDAVDLVIRQNWK